MPQEYRIPLPGETPARKSHACLYGCLILCVGFCCLMLAGGLGGYFVFKKAGDYFLDSKPMALPGIQLSDVEKQAVLERWTAFSKAAETKSPASITLTEQEVNVVLQSRPGMEDFGKSVYVTLEGDTIRGELSYELLPGRFINGAAALSVSVVKGRLMVFLEDLQFKGQTVPDAIVGELKGRNLAEGYDKDPQLAVILNRVTEFSVKDGKLTIRLGENTPAGTLV